MALALDPNVTAVRIKFHINRFRLELVDAEGHHLHWLPGEYRSVRSAASMGKAGAARMGYEFLGYRESVGGEGDA